MTEQEILNKIIDWDAAAETMDDIKPMLDAADLDANTCKQFYKVATKYGADKVAAAIDLWLSINYGEHCIGNETKDEVLKTIADIFNKSTIKLANVCIEELTAADYKKLDYIINHYFVTKRIDRDLSSTIEKFGKALDACDMSMALRTMINVLECTAIIVALGGISSAKTIKNAFIAKTKNSIAYDALDAVISLISKKDDIVQHEKKFVVKNNIKNPYKNIK